MTVSGTRMTTTLNQRRSVYALLDIGASETTRNEFSCCSREIASIDRIAARMTVVTGCRKLIIAAYIDGPMRYVARFESTTGTAAGAAEPIVYTIALRRKRPERD